MFDYQAIKKAAIKSVDKYSQITFLTHEITNRLLDRLQYIRKPPTKILEIQTRDGYLSHQLTDRYKRATMVSLDFIDNHFHSNESLSSKTIKVCGDFDKLPFHSHQFDCVVSNLCLQSTNLDKIFKEVFRVLAPQGVFFFTLLGPDTLKELRASFQNTSPYAHVHPFIDMHDIGDLMLAHHFVDPVMDMEYLTLQYSWLDQLFSDLKAAGAVNVRHDRLKNLMGKNRWKKMIEYYEQWRENKVLPVTLEIIYGHAWAPENKKINRTNHHGEILVPIESLKLSKGNRHE